MPIEVDMPDGSVAEFPDGTDKSVIQRALSKHVKAKESMSWSDVPSKALSNLPSSAAKFASDIVQPVLHPIDTAKAIGNIGYGLASKAAGAIGVEQDPKTKAENEAVVNAIGQHFADRYGSAGGFKKALAEDPVGVAGDLSIFIGAPGALASKAGGIVGKAGNAASAVANAIDPLNVTAQAAKTAGKIPATVLGVTTGAGSLPIKQAYTAGREGSTVFADHMRGKRPLDEAVDMADSAISTMKQNRSDAYEAGMASTKASGQQLDLKPIFSSIQDGLDVAVYNGVAKSPDAVKRLHAMAEIVHEFRNMPYDKGRTPVAFDAMKQALGVIWKGAEDDVARMATGKVYNAVKDEIVKQVPEYAKTMKAYSEASDTLNDIKKTFSATDKASTDTKIRKLQSVMRNNVNTSWGYRGQLADELAQFQPEIMNALAGQALNSWEPRGLARLGAQLTGVGGASAIGAGALNPLALATLPLASPRLMGEAAYGLGQGARMVRGAADLGGSVVPNALMGAYELGNVARPLQVTVYPPGDPRNQ